MKTQTRCWAGLVVAGACLWNAGCGPWLTSIPTYWDPVIPQAPGFDEEAAEPASLPAPAVAAKPVTAKPVAAPPERPPQPPPPPPCMAVYVATAQNQLFAFFPKESRFEFRGRLDCPSRPWATPFSMAVARTGVARVLYNDGRLYEVLVHDATCKPTSFVPNPPPGFRLFGMGYGTNGADGEQLYVASIRFTGPSLGLASIDDASYQLQFIGKLSQNPGYHLELTPTGSGPLHGFFINEGKPGGTLVQIDTRTGTIVDARPLNVGTASRSLAVSWWGGFFYIFTGYPGGSEATRYDPETGQTQVVAELDQTIVGAGVSTCAPDR
ncbi:MAG: hypothetical protein JRI68_22335 [Deltaproteobacteria bacterium]|nr:hypothetical protein [Deltaproteobacteria bacterium]